MAEDADSEEFGSYVTKTGGTEKMFINREGYAADSDDCFWYYEDGNKLDAFNCWDGVDSMEMLKNTHYITHEVTKKGTRSIQSWNSYGLLDASGAVTNAVSAQSWELSSTMDAAVLQMTARLKGITGLDYTIDLSGVKITPSYSTSDPTYAFMGFYAWQDWYVLSLGIACDTSTGNWYAYEATSRDDSFSDAVYDMGDCIMTSTWNEAGYFVPDKTEVKMSIGTKILEDDDGEYQVDDLSIEVKDGATYRRRITDSYVNDKFNHALGAENGYIFVAGLDIKNKVVSGVKTENADYFNGAKFENLTVKAATAHVPTAEEMSDVKYGYEINADWRGKEHDLVLAGAENTPGVIDYTILNTNSCVTYRAVDGKDVYSFSYDGAVSDTNVLGSNAAEYQGKIDALKTITEQNAVEREAEIEAVGEWYGADVQHTGSKLAQKYLNVMDFAPYLAAKETLAAAATLTEAGEAFVEAFNELTPLATYAYKGWTAPEDAESVAGYIYSELLKFKESEKAYDALTGTDRNAVFKHISKADFEMWQELSVNLQETDYERISFEGRTEGSAGTAKTYTGLEALQEVLEWSYKIKTATVWTTTENDDPNEKKDDDGNVVGGLSAVMNSDNTWLPSFHVCYLIEKLTEAGAELPQFAWNYLDAIGYEEFYTDFGYLYNVLDLAAKIESGEVAALTENVAEIVNAYLLNVDSFADAGLVWNFENSKGKDFTYRDKSYKSYFGLTKTTDLIDYVKVVTDFLKARDSGVTLTASGLGVAKEVEAENLTVSEQAKAVLDSLKELDSSQVNEFTAICNGTFAALSDYDKTVVVEFFGRAEFEGRLQLAADLTALAADSAYADGTFTAYTTLMAKETSDFTSAQAMEQLLYWGGKIAAGAGFAENENDDPNGAAAKVMNGDNTFYPSLRVVACVEYFNGLGVELPAYVRKLLVKIGYDDFYQGFFYPFYQTTQLAQHIRNNNVTTLDGLTAAQIAFLNEVWTCDYTLSAQIAWNWNSGNKMQLYYAGRSARIVFIAGGALTKTSGEGEAAEQIPYTIGDYYQVVAEFLAGLGYTVNANGWGVTAETIA